MTWYYVVYDKDDLGRTKWSGELCANSKWDDLVAEYPEGVMKIEKGIDEFVRPDDFYVDVATEKLIPKIKDYPITIPADLKAGVTYRITNIPLNTFVLFPDGHGEIDTDGYIEFEFDISGLYPFILDHPHYYNQEIILDVEA